LDREETERVIRKAFERAPVLTERLLAGAPYGSAREILERARSILGELSEPERIAVLDAHPRIGANAATLSETSRLEQGPDADPNVQHHLEVLNEEYERRFGFRFVTFVAGRSQREVLPELRDRLGGSREEEMASGSAAFLAIAADRLGLR
jgi:2-oxo-4-hydroxy-4-carboxy--5-ureidoimidazoline (OHCU) decarboxylase